MQNNQLLAVVDKLLVTMYDLIEKETPPPVVNITKNYQMNTILQDSVVMGNIEQKEHNESMFDLDDLDL